MTDAGTMWDDFLRELRTEELKSSFGRAKIEYLQQSSDIQAPRFQRAEKPGYRTLPPEAEVLWGEDRSQWHVHELALERAIDKERQEGTPEDVLVNVQRGLELWREKAAEEIKARRSL